MKLFEHIQGNRFKLLENKEIINMKTEVSDENKLVGISPRITKEEEGRALQLIREKLIPSAIQAYNRYIDVQQGFAEGSKITDKEVRMNLKKSDRTTHPARGNPKKIDIIRYISKINNGKFPMTFDIIKKPRSIYVEWSHQFRDYGSGVQKVMLYNTELSEGKIFSIKEGDTDFYMSKEEESYAYTYLVRRVLPSVVRDMYLAFLSRFPQMYPEKKYPRITPQDVVKHIKKQRTNIDSRTYESVINDHVYFTFFIKKKLIKTTALNGKEIKKPMVMIAAQGPINTDWSYYEVK